jgi:hypothetical protein
VIIIKTRDIKEIDRIIHKLFLDIIGFKKTKRHIDIYDNPRAIWSNEDIDNDTSSKINEIKKIPEAILL